MKKSKILMTIICIITFIINIFYEPTRFICLVWILIALMNTHINYGE
ncbi:TPA: hypothetical protein PTV74_003177 [Clostridium botulinum]|nr:hypothetical protein [Clostridium botulinum]HDK7206332.1 hypothetical protein [Clostridium botulinum]HDK7210068.1 hypothetical protein [Clostridium botulinum]HDK7265517.1 hypothetical protein [Clostridium botulinum]HDK7269365.1 hypothetical protein [Clostridium botulinum]